MDAFTGEIRAFANSFAPAGWARCDGQIMPISQYTALFSLIGTIYGGNGSTTFALPNLQGSVPNGTGQLLGGSSYALGENGGVTNVTLLNSEMPIHTHTFNGGAATTASDAVTVPASNTNIANPVNKTHGGIGRGYVASTGLQPNAQLNPMSIGVTGATQSHDNMMPYLAFTYCICLSGIFPQRP